jgi:hypothetical protein
MPKAVKRAPVEMAESGTASPVPVLPVTPTIALQVEEPALTVFYDKLTITEYSTMSKIGALTPADMKSILGWETEKEYQKRMVTENQESKPEHWLYGDVFHCLDTEKQKVRCWNNANNRPFDMGWCEDLVHTILYGQWAGPLMMPGETVNGETVRISRYGRVLSGQHQGTALILADEWLQKSRSLAGNAVNPKYPAWNGHNYPVIETVVITGLSEDPRILMTIDYVKPRSLADLLYTMPLYKDKTPVERKELTRMLAAAVDMLWTRTGTNGYKTHPECAAFLERHKRLLKCVEHLFIENSAKGADGGRKISKLRLSAGQCSALCYLMACSDDKGVDNYGDVYRNESPPSERGLNWTHWDRAQDFWVRLAGDRAFMPVRKALGLLVDSTPQKEDNQGQGGRLPEKLAIVAKAWEVYRDHPDSAGAAFDDVDLAPGGPLCLSYSNLDDKGNQLPDGQIKLLDVADFYGIDCPEVVTNKGKMTGRADAPEPPAPSREEIERATQEALTRRMQKAP